MTESNTQNDRIVACFKIMVRTSTLFLLLSLIVSLKTGSIYFGFIIGIFIGQISFKLLILAFGNANEKNNANFGFVLLSFVKLISIAVLVFFLFKYGVSIQQIVVGLFLSQIASIISFVYIIIFLNK